MTKKILAWHFVCSDRTLRYGSGLSVEPGYIYSAKGTLKLCANGMHASVDAFHALQYAPGPILCRVRCWGEIEDGDDKLVCRHREVLAMRDMTRELRLFAVWCARDMPIGGGARMWDILPEHSRKIVSATEQVAIGAIPYRELQTIRDSVWRKVFSASGCVAHDAAWAASRESAWLAAMDASVFAEHTAQCVAAKAKFEKMCLAAMEAE